MDGHLFKSSPRIIAKNYLVINLNEIFRKEMSTQKISAAQKSFDEVIALVVRHLNEIYPFPFVFYFVLFCLIIYSLQSFLYHWAYLDVKIKVHWKQRRLLFTRRQEKDKRDVGKFNQAQSAHITLFSLWVNYFFFLLRFRTMPELSAWTCKIEIATDWM